MPKWSWDDGGRREWGMPVSTRDRDCAVRALAIATRRPYGDIWNVLNDLCVNATGRSAEENGVPANIARAVYRRFGMVAYDLPAPVTVDDAIGFWPNGIFVLRKRQGYGFGSTGHTVAVWRGRLRDTQWPRPAGERFRVSTVFVKPNQRHS